MDGKSKSEKVWNCRKDELIKGKNWDLVKFSFINLIEIQIALKWYITSGI